MWGMMPLNTGTRKVMSTQFGLKEKAVYAKCEWLAIRTDEPRRCAQMLPASKSFHCKYLFLFHLTRNNWLDSRKFVCQFLCYTTKSGQMVLIVPHRFSCIVMINQPGLSCHVDRGFHCGDFPAPTLSLLISKWIFFTLPGWHMETVGAWNRVIQISSLPHPCCGAAFAAPQIEQSHRQQSKHGSALLAPESWWFLLAAQA